MAYKTNRPVTWRDTGSPTAALEKYNPAARHVATMVNLNEGHEAKIKRAMRLEGMAMEERGVGPLYTMSPDLAAGLARLYKPVA